jgi:hypothetical protein
VDPVMDGRLADVELPGYLVLGSTAADGGDDRSPTTGFPVIFWLMATSEDEGFSIQDTAD